MTIVPPVSADDVLCRMFVAVLWGLGFYAGFVGSQERRVTDGDLHHSGA
jgi:hypothetical protein